MKFLFNQENDELSTVPGDAELLERMKNNPLRRIQNNVFFGLLSNNTTKKEMSPVLNFPIVIIRRMYKRYIAGDYVNLTTFKTAGQNFFFSSQDGEIPHGESWDLGEIPQPLGYCKTPTH
ncbi:hypothetical protein NGRA_0580 [Nosema granulosis]|uniref:Uncharacterized protein n=1 Tax=Nosema granulosis TaxID=83296 RepID=A0A9P6L004_9MICR|nr:hypothetical protein NGRA_0580 [Nosema granulosis]